MKIIVYIFLLSITICNGANHERIVPFILKWEGGYAKLPNDPGGETNKGVTWATWIKFYGRTHDEFIRMPEAKWAHIWKVGYWDKVYGDDIKSQDIAEVLSEWCWGSGAIIPTKSVQRILGLKADGVFGEQTVNAINKANQKWLYEELIAARFKFLARIPYFRPSNWMFIDGWLNRMTGFVFFQSNLKD